MPTISSFYGIIVQMFWGDHAPPHFHALYAEYEVLIDIRTLESLRIIGGLEIMRAESNAEKNIAPEIICSGTKWRLAKVKPCKDYKLEVEFNDGLCGIVEMGSLVMSNKAGVFSELKNVEFFNQVYLEYGVVTWPGEIDIAPDVMYDQIRYNGKCVL